MKKKTKNKKTSDEENLKYASDMEATLVLLVEDDRLSLAEKRKGPTTGFLNGPGGRIEQGEDPETAARRETGEEFGVQVAKRDLHKVALITFVNHKDDGTVFTCLMHVYRAHKWKGKIHRPAAERLKMGIPKWYKTSRLPFERLTDADGIWMPMVLKGYKLQARFQYAPRQSRLVDEFEVTIVQTAKELEKSA
jgi:8-oxo-dGTP diphosphatase